MGGEQKNKPHKSRFSSKGQRHKHKGDESNLPHRPSIRKAMAPAAARVKRIQHAKQVRDQKRSDAISGRRSSNCLAPRIVGLVPLSEEGVDIQGLREALLAARLSSLSGDDGMVDPAPEGPVTIVSARHRLRLTILSAAAGDLLGCIEIAKVADVLMLVAPAVAPSAPNGKHVDEWGRKCLSALRALGFPGLVGVIQGLSQVAEKKRTDVKKVALAAIHVEVGPDVKVLPMDSADDGQQMFRHLSEHHFSGPVWRTQRPYIVAHQVEYSPDPETASGGGKGTLVVTGYVRSRAISVNQLVHVSGGGDFQLAQIDGLSDPYSLNPRRGGGGKAGPSEDADMNEGTDISVGKISVLAVADPEAREPLIFENTPDPLANEQTWPTENELDNAEIMRKKLLKRRVPKGTSEYQAEWLAAVDDTIEEEVDEEDETMEGDGRAEGDGTRRRGPRVGRIAAEDEEDEEDEEEEEGSVDMEERGGKATASRPGSMWGGSDDDDDGRSEFMSVGAMDEDEGMTMEEREQERQRLKALHRADEEFPDEIDTPMDIPARKRFAKYRGLKSFRTSPWDPKETLPLDYARVFAFDNFKRTQKHVLARALEADRGTLPGTVTPGSFVRLHVANVPAATAEKLLREAAQSPLVVSGLLQHESKMSVIHYSIKKFDSYAEPIKSKEPLIFHSGFRRFHARPIFSTDDLNIDKHKFERFLHPGRFSIASVYAPVAFPPLPLLVFKAELPVDPALPAHVAGEKLTLVAAGALRNAEPDRVILKKIILSGYPLRVQKRKAVVRYMFHNPEDVWWFKPLELWSKYGRRGRIKEPVGTHGNMKCIFDGTIQQRDAVCISLYKRIYPRWPGSLN